MAVTVNIPDELIFEVLKATGERTKTKAITIAMKEFITQKKKIEQLLALRGNVEINYNWKKEEAIEMRSQKKREKRLR